MTNTESNQPEQTNSAPLSYDELAGKVVELTDIIARKDQELTNLYHSISLLKRQAFGRKSEKHYGSVEQLPLFLEDVPVLAKEPKAEVITYTRKKANGRTPVPKDIPVERFEYEPEETTCNCCGKNLEKIGEEVTAQLDVKPMVFTRIELVRIKRACPNCKQSGVVIGKIPAEKQVYDRCKAAPGLMAQVMVGKFGDHQPLNRQEQIFERHGIKIPRSTMWDWEYRAAELLKPVVEQMRLEILSAKKIHADETHLDQVVDGGILKRYLWGFLGERNVVFRFGTRCSDPPRQFFGDYKGFIQTDGYVVYDNIAADLGVTRVGCWVHARRKFFDLKGTHPAERETMLKLIARLYQIEREAKQRELNAEDIVAKRKAESEPVLQTIKALADNWSLQALPKSPLAEAVYYLRNQWEALTVFINHAYIELDNNPAEREMRKIALGRNNWMFVESENGAHCAALFFSLINTCKLNRINPLRYLTAVLPLLKPEQKPDYAALTPVAWASTQKQIPQA